MEHLSPSLIKHQKTESLTSQELFRKNYFFNNHHEFKKYHQQVSEYIRTHTESEIRQDQIAIYHELLKSVLGLDPKDDPYQEVTGKRLEELFMRQATLSPDYHYSKSISPVRTVVISGETLLDSDIRHNFFDPLTLVPEKDWQLQFGFTITSYKDLFFVQGAILIEPEIAQTLELHDTQGHISSLLGDILSWFNHDGTAHSVFVPIYGTFDTDIIDNSSETIPFLEMADPKGYSQTHSSSALVGEMWSLNLHENLFQKMIAKRPAIARFLSHHIHKYLKEVEHLVEHLNNPGDRNAVRTYLIKSYAFPFFRLLNPKELRTQEAYQDIFEKYPDIDNLGPAEDHVREYVYGTSGIQNPKNPKEFTSHQDYIQRILDTEEITLETRKEYLETKEKYVEILKQIVTQEGIIDQQQLKLFHKYFLREDSYNIARLLNNCFKVNKREGESFSMIVNKNKNEVVNYLVNHPGDPKTFLDRVYKHVYGFTADEIKKNHFKKIKNNEYFLED